MKKNELFTGIAYIMAKQVTFTRKKVKRPCNLITNKLNTRPIVLIINAFLCLCLSPAMAQENEVFPTKNAEWKLRCNGYFYYGVNYHVDDYTVSLTDRDTLCLGKTYTLFTEGERKGGLRVENSKVWCTFNWKHEILLYDFDVKEGDTIVHGAVYKDYPYFIKEAFLQEEDSSWLNRYEYLSIVDRIEIEGDQKLIYVTRYQRDPDYSPFYPGDEHIDYWGEDIWQEGIGSLNGLFIHWATMEFQPTCCIRMWHLQSYTLSMTHNDQVNYDNPGIPEIPEYPEIIYGFDEIYMDQFKIQYDETSRILSAICKDPNMEGILYLHDLSGKTILNVSVKGDTQIAISSNLKGYHLCTISRNNTIAGSLKIKL